MRFSRLSVVLLFGISASCGSDDPTAPNVTFPPLPTTMLEARCAQGNRTIYQNMIGTLTDTDCDTGDIDGLTEPTGYYETWRVRLPASGQVTFSANSVFDNTLFVARIDSVTADSLAYTILAENDDRSGTNLNALITITLEGSVDYLLGIAGFNPLQLGSYQVNIN